MKTDIILLSRSLFISTVFINVFSLFGYGAEPNYGLSLTPAEITQPTRFLGLVSGDPGSENYVAGEGALLDLSNGVSVGSSGSPSSVTTGWSARAIISLGGNDGIYGSEAARIGLVPEATYDYGSLGVKADAAAVSIYGEYTLPSDNGDYMGFYVKTASSVKDNDTGIVTGSVSNVDIATVERSTIHMTLNQNVSSINPAYWFNALLVENFSKDINRYGGDQYFGTASVSLSNIDITLISNASNIVNGGAVRVNAVTTGVTASFVGSDSVNIVTSGADNHGVRVLAADANSSIRNAGSISTNGNSAHGVFLTGGGYWSTATIENSGTIVVQGTSSNAINVNFAGGYLNIINSGKLESANGYAIYIADGAIEQSLTLTLQEGSEITGNVYLSNATGTNKRTLAIGNTHQVIDGNLNLSGDRATLSLTIMAQNDFGKLIAQDINIMGTALNVTLDAGFHFDENIDTYIEFDIINGVINGAFSNAVDGGIYSTGGYDFNVSYEANGMKLWMGTLIPEPTTYSLMAGMLLFVMVLSRRRP